MQPQFLPTTIIEAKLLNWYPLDIIIITGDAYIDHPTFGAALIGRYLVSKGFTVGIISQPNWKDDTDFKKLGKPNIYFGITSGNMDSMINHYTAQKKKRSEDSFSPSGKTNLRPNRAILVYSQKIRHLYKESKIIIGGLEASLRRIPHYDYWSDKIRNSILFDSRADILIYGMGERTSYLVAKVIKNKEDLTSIKGTTVIASPSKEEDFIRLPDFSDDFNKNSFYKMSKIFDENFRDKTIYMKFAGRFLKHNPLPKANSMNEMDLIYNLPFSRLPHPIYKKNKIAAFEQIKNSITSHRGCFGGCNFCAIGYHQGKTIQSRSKNSILQEIDILSRKEYFKGTISDIGGPSANMYGMYCKKNISEVCKKHSCIYPEICDNLEFSHKPIKKMLLEAGKQAKVKHLFIASGIRFDLSLHDKDYIRLVAQKYTGGYLKLAPEHKSSKVLKFMRKPDFIYYEEFLKIFKEYSQKSGSKQFVIPYIIVGHPGSTLADTIELAVYLKRNNIRLKQIQEFTPTPMTISTCMYFTERDFDSGKKINVPKGREIKLMKALVQWYNPENKKYIIEALKKAGKLNLSDVFLGAKKRVVVTESVAIRRKKGKKKL